MLSDNSHEAKTTGNPGCDDTGAKQTVPACCHTRRIWNFTVSLPTTYRQRQALLSSKSVCCRWRSQVVPRRVGGRRADARERTNVSSPTHAKTTGRHGDRKKLVVRTPLPGLIVELARCQHALAKKLPAAHLVFVVRRQPARSAVHKSKEHTGVRKCVCGGLFEDRTCTEFCRANCCLLTLIELEVCASVLRHAERLLQHGYNRRRVPKGNSFRDDHSYQTSLHGTVKAAADHLGVGRGRTTP